MNFQSKLAPVGRKNMDSAWASLLNRKRYQKACPKSYSRLVTSTLGELLGPPGRLQGLQVSKMILFSIICHPN